MVRYYCDRCKVELAERHHAMIEERDQELGGLVRLHLNTEAQLEVHGHDGGILMRPVDLCFKCILELAAVGPSRPGIAFARAVGV